MKKIILILTMTALLLLTACGNGISGDEAKAAADEFFKYISDGKYAEAEDMFHPDIVMKGNIESLFKRVGERAGADIEDGFSVRYTSFSSSLYDSEYGGAHYELSGIIEVSGYLFDLEIEFINRDDVFGIYDLDIDID